MASLFCLLFILPVYGQQKPNDELSPQDIGTTYSNDQQRKLESLEQQNRLKKLYITGISITAIVVFMLMIFTLRVLRQTRKNHNETQKRNRSLTIAMAELENANKNITRIVHIMAHDLRAPLSGIIGLASAIKDDNGLNADSRHMVDLIESSSTRTLDMIDELLKTGLTDGKESFVKQAVDITAMLVDLVELLQFKADEKQLSIIFNNAEEPIIAEVNREKIWRVFNNIIINAIKFSHRGGTIQVELSRPSASTILVSVKDEGVGIPVEEHDRVFEMFTKAKRVGTDGEKSFGLGLAISKRIINMHNGRLWFESQPGVGTTFYLELPL